MASKIPNPTEALSAYFNTPPCFCAPYGNGHINDTFLTVHQSGKFILQKMNTSIFPDTEQLMKNILGVTGHIRAKAGDGKDAERATLEVIPTLGGAPYYNSKGGAWRMYRFTEGTVTLEAVRNSEDFRRCAEAFGRFQHQLSDYPAHTLGEVIPNFHNTPIRHANLMRAAETDICGRAKDVLDEIGFAAKRKEFCETLEKAHRDGRLPLRVTHNDTKLNNILFDEKTFEPVCVIDLDTVMPGYSVNDFGDSIRFGANTASEDETDLSKVALDLTLFEAYAQGFIVGCGGSLTAHELELLPAGAIMMTLECGMRFLTDYLEGDTYFKIHRPRHNLDRARNQFKLVADMESKYNSMMAIIDRLK